MQFAKMQPYDTDIRIPFFISKSGGDAHEGITRDIMANNIDIAPTILDIAGIDYKLETNMDGKSLLPYVLMDAVDGDDLVEDEDFSMFLVEYNGEGYTHDEYRMCDSHVDGFDAAKCDSWNNTFSCIRWMDKKNGDDFVYCNFKCFTEGRIETECDGDYNSVESKGEYYNLNEDPWQMNNLWDTLSLEQVDYFNEKLMEFKSCLGDECRDLFAINDVIDVLVNDNDEKLFDVDGIDDKSKDGIFYDLSRLLAFIAY